MNQSKSDRKCKRNCLRNWQPRAWLTWLQKERENFQHFQEYYIRAFLSLSLEKHLKSNSSKQLSSFKHLLLVRRYIRQFIKFIYKLNCLRKTGPVVAFSRRFPTVFTGKCWCIKQNRSKCLWKEGLSATKEYRFTTNMC